MSDPELAVAYRTHVPEFQVARELIRLRLQLGLSREELAQRAGAGRPNISRLERAPINPSLRFLGRVAAALGAQVGVRFRPLEAADG